MPADFHYPHAAHAEASAGHRSDHDVSLPACLSPVAEFQSPPKALMSRTDALNRRASVSIALRRAVSAAFSVDTTSR
jgi:hypothetical protein